MGNIMQKDLFDIWTGKIMTKYRKDLLNGERKSIPCKSCYAEGILLLGKHHAKTWKKLFNI